MLFRIISHHVVAVISDVGFYFQCRVWAVDAASGQTQGKHMVGPGATGNTPSALLDCSWEHVRHICLTFSCPIVALERGRKIVSIFSRSPPPMPFSVRR
jgi:hypothetical protein